MFFLFLLQFFLLCPFINKYFLKRYVKLVTGNILSKDSKKKKKSRQNQSDVDVVYNSIKTKLKQTDDKILVNKWNKIEAKKRTNKQATKPKS